ncbi:hypothetical protein GCM10011414_06430 [Croceivirga lutea]|nr:hypothetical protein GCM10011414_06430 [Croceivirga lutea]
MNEKINSNVLPFLNQKANSLKPNRSLKDSIRIKMDNRIIINGQESFLKEPFGSKYFGFLPIFLRKKETKP